MKKEIICFTPSIRVFIENIGCLENVKLKATTLDTKMGEIVLFTGSILDKSEIDYRNLTKSWGRYYTVIPTSLEKSEVDTYWHKHTTVVYKDELLGFLNKH